jgi:hypothetical protein
VWHGLYTYPSRGMRVIFDATLIQGASFLTGTTHEIATSGAMKGQMILAQLDGERRGGAVTFRKTYDPGIPNYTAPIQYEGALSADGTEIEGRWAISSTWSGKFLMIRSTGKAQAVERKVFERI